MCGTPPPGSGRGVVGVGRGGRGRYEIATGCVEVVSIHLPVRLPSPGTSLYYKLTGFYQNHRGYGASRSEAQLSGHVVSREGLVEGCGPRTGFRVREGAEGEGAEELIYAPCGLVPWSMFNDTVRMYRGGENSGNRSLVCDTASFDREGAPTEEMGCEKKGIAWESDRRQKFRPPQGENLLTCEGLPNHRDYFARNGYYYGEAGHRIPCTSDEDLMVWMSTASLPTFRKLWRRFTTDLEPGPYTLEITNRFDVSGFGSRKYIVIATHSWFGGNGLFLGVAYLATGAAALCLAGVIFLFGIR